jgi:hypothetical protein
VEREVIPRAVANLVVGDRVKVLVDQPGRVIVLLREAGDAGILAGQGKTVRSNSALTSPVAWDPRGVMTWMSLRLLVWWPRSSSLTRVPGVEARACPMMRLAPSCRATRRGFLWRQTSGSRQIEAWD